MPLRLIIEDDEGSTTIVPLSADAITIGRQPGNTIQLTEKNVSRRHARLFPEGEAWVIEDLGSYNGIKINGEPIAERVRLQEGDVVQIGDYHLALTEDVDKKTLNFESARKDEAANDEPLLASSSTLLPRLTKEELDALHTGPQDGVDGADEADGAASRAPGIESPPEGNESEPPSQDDAAQVEPEDRAVVPSDASASPQETEREAEEPGDDEPGAHEAPVPIGLTGAGAPSVAQTVPLQGDDEDEPVAARSSTGWVIGGAALLGIVAAIYWMSGDEVPPASSPSKPAVAVDVEDEKTAADSEPVDRAAPVDPEEDEASVEQASPPEDASSEAAMVEEPDDDMLAAEEEAAADEDESAAARPERDESDAATAQREPEPRAARSRPKERRARAKADAEAPERQPRRARESQPSARAAPAAAVAEREEDSRDSGAEDTPDPDELLTQARMLQFKDPQEAYALAKEAFGLKRSQGALVVMASAACRMGDVAKAKRAVGRLRGDAKEKMVSACRKQDVDPL